jgi:DNA invertase Pin-like site-specific DNA recombinase
MIVGYARVSTDGQTLDAQQAQLRSAGVEKVYSEKISGAITDRPALAKAINGLGNGDVLVVCKLDRLALILARTSEGRKRAQARGVRFGRKLKLTAHQQQEALARRSAGEALVDIARSYAVSHSTISRLA